MPTGQRPPPYLEDESTVSNHIEIVIRARDQFSLAFEKLASVFGKTHTEGQGAQTSLGNLGSAMEKLAEVAMNTQSAIGAFSSESSQQLQTLSEERQAALEAFSQQQEETARALGETLVAIDEETATQREINQGDFFARQKSAEEAHAEKILEQHRKSNQQLIMADTGNYEARLAIFKTYTEVLLALAETQGKEFARIAKAVSIAEALVKAYVAANNALASVPYPYNIPLAGLVLAHGLANVERIRQVNVAHGGLERVPEDSTYLLRQGERVLTAGQNKDLSRFLDRGSDGSSGGGVTIQNLTIHVLENATQADALLEMDAGELRQIVSDRIIPALDELARLGIRPNFVESNT